MDLSDKELTQKIIACAYAVHNALGAGFLEKVYERPRWQSRWIVRGLRSEGRYR
jgi:hypothetical protein